MRAGAIDIGTNSVLLLATERDPSGQVQVVAERAEITRLGARVDASGALDPNAIARTLAVLEDYRAQLDRLGVARLGAVGTSALRDAANARAFVEPAEAILGCAIEVASGPREAALVRRGVSSTFTDLGAADVIFDVGGGSTEFVVCEAPPRLVSLNMGTVRLTERIVRHDPPTSAELASVRDAVLEQLARLERFFPARIARLIGVAGTVTTLVTLELELAVYDSARVNGASIERSQIARLEQHLASMPLARRRELVGLDARRADVIVAGAVLVGTVMDQLEISRLHVSDRGVRWGLVHELSADSPVVTTRSR